MKATSRPIGLSIIVMILLTVIGIQRSTQTPVHAGDPHAPNEHPFYQGGSEWVYVCGMDCTNPLARTPTTMLTGMGYNVQMHIQNTGNATWNHVGSNPVRLSYHWYDSSGQNVVTWDGLRTDLGQDVGPSGDVGLNARVLAPLQPGTYVLKWDMVKEGVTWFSWQQNWSTQEATVNVQQAPGVVYLPIILRNLQGQ